MRRISRFRRSPGKLSLKSFLCHNLVSTYCLVFVFWLYVFISVPSVFSPLFSPLCFSTLSFFLFPFFLSLPSLFFSFLVSQPSLFTPILALFVPSASFLSTIRHPFLFLPPSPHIISPPLPSILAIFVSSASVLSTIRHHFSLPAILSFHPSLPYSHFLPLSPPSAPARRAKSYSS